MFSEAIERLRVEAQKTTATNAELLSKWHFSLGPEGEYFKQVQDDLYKTSVTTFLAGAAGVAATAESYHAVAFGSAMFVEKALIGLGSIAVESSTLPIAGVVSFGVAVLGFGMLAVNSAMVLVNKEIPFEEAAEIAGNARANANGHDGRIGVSNWLKGAKKIIVSQVADRLLGTDGIKSPEFQNSVKRADVVWEGIFNGKVVDVSNGIATQKIGRDPDVVVKHDLDNLSCGVRKDDVLNIKYTNGKGTVTNKALPGVEL